MKELGSGVSSSGAVSSLEVFADVADLMRKAPVSVSRLDSANSVWVAEFGNGSKVIFKYFRRHFPKFDRFKSERTVYESNANSKILPRLILSDPYRRLLVFEYIDQVDLTAFTIKSLLENTIGKIGELVNEVRFENSRPLFLDSWLDEDFNFGPAENIILRTAKKSITIASSISRLIGSWSTESLLHGDLKLSNYLFSADRFYIIDWETVCYGPEEWDSAGLLQSVILEIVSKGPRLQWSVAQAPELTALLLDAEQTLIDAITARLVQSSMEATQTSLRIPVVAANTLQAAEYISARNFDFLAKI